MTRLAEPLDELHRSCLVAREQINDVALGLKMVAAKWEPRPMPTGWRPDDEQ